jgi:hypothetical protein
VIVGVSGGRDYELTEEDRDAFVAILRCLRPEEFWHGGARGVDLACAQLAGAEGFHVRTIAAPWNELDPVGDIRFSRNDAGPLRNWWMARELRNAGGGAWIFFPGGVGTNDMMQQCRAHLIRTIDLRRKT